MEHIGKILNKLVLHKGEISRDMVCEKHGPYVSRLYGTRTWMDCQVCLEEGWAKKSTALDASRREESMARWREILGDAGIPSAYEHCTISGWQAIHPTSNKVMQQLEDYSENLGRTIAEGKNLVLIGWTGTGKTHALAALTMQAIREGKSAIFVGASKVFRAVKDSWGRSTQQNSSDVFKALAAVDLLCIDEIQEMDATERKIVFEVINDRYERGKPVCVSSNLGKPAFAKFVGDRTLDRLVDRDSTVCIMEWPSYRRGQW